MTGSAQVLIGRQKLAIKAALVLFHYSIGLVFPYRVAHTSFYWVSIRITDFRAVRNNFTQ